MPLSSVGGWDDYGSIRTKLPTDEATSPLDSAWTSQPAPTPGAPGASGPAPASAATPTAARVTENLGVSPQVTPQATAAPSTPDYSQHVAAAQSGDPVAADTLARQVASDLQAAGHQVTWKGSQLIVDGRAYDVAGSQPSASSTPTAVTQPGGAWGPSASDPASMAQREREIADAYRASLGRDPKDYEYTFWIGNPNYAAEIAASPEAQRYAQTGVVSPDLGHSPIAVNDDKWNDPTHQTAKYTFAHVLAGGGSLAQAAAAIGATVDPKDDRYIIFQGQPVKVHNHDQSNWYWEPQGAGGATGGGTGDALASAWGGSSSGLGAPGMMSLSDMASMWGGSPASSSSIGGADLDALMRQILQHPESINPQTLQTMEAADAEGQQAAAQSGDAESKRLGFAAGLEDSPWLASERAANLRSADQGILTGRRDLALSAAKTNAADLRSAATTGMNYAQIKGNLDIAAQQLGISRAQLAQQLLLRIAELEQNDQQFGADLGYRYDALNSSNANNYWDNVTA